MGGVERGTKDSSRRHTGRRRHARGGRMRVKPRIHSDSRPGHIHPHPTPHPTPLTKTTPHTQHPITTHTPHPITAPHTPYTHPSHTIHTPHTPHHTHHTTPHHTPLPTIAPHHVVGQQGKGHADLGRGDVARQSPHPSQRVENLRKGSGVPSRQTCATAQAGVHKDTNKQCCSYLPTMDTTRVSHEIGQSVCELYLDYVRL